jgi:adenylyl-sulfate kinase
VNEDLFPSQTKVIRARQPSILLTGLSGSGKSTIARHLELYLNEIQHSTFVLDGDNIRQGICSNLGFSELDRFENVRRVAEVSKLFNEGGIFCISALIAPNEKMRHLFRSIVGNNYIEIFVDCSIEECEKRDVKGLYAKARKGLISGFTGVDSTYEIPQSPDLVLKTSDLTVDECIVRSISFLKERGLI